MAPTCACACFEDLYAGTRIINGESLFTNIFRVYLRAPSIQLETGRAAGNAKVNKVR